jgi:pimeloyl-ACP methyl ester carboxylesterase
VAVLRVDDRGVGGSTGDIEAATTADFAGDVLAGVEFLKREPQIDSARIGLVGHSEGALVAPLAASQSKDVAFIVLLAAPGLRGQELLYLQSAVLMKAMGVDQETIDLNHGVQEKIFSIVNEEADDAAAEKKLLAMQQEQFSSLSEQERKALGVVDDSVMSSQAKMLLNRWFRFFLSYDPVVALEKVKCPVLVVSGERDLQVPPRENLPPVEKALKSGGNGSVQVVELPGLNHLLQTARTGLPSEYAEIDETIAPVALETIGDWIANQALASGKKPSPDEN